MDLVFRLLIGIPIFMIAGFINYFLLNITMLVFATLATASAKLFRRALGVRGSWVRGWEVSVTVCAISKTLIGATFGTGLFLYCFLFPRLSDVSLGLTFASGLILLLVWFPGMFFTNLFGQGLLGEDVETERRSDASELKNNGWTGARIVLGGTFLVILALIVGVGVGIGMSWFTDAEEVPATRDDDKSTRPPKTQIAKTPTRPPSQLPVTATQPPVRTTAALATLTSPRKPIFVNAYIGSPNGANAFSDPGAYCAANVTADPRFGGGAFRFIGDSRPVRLVPDEPNTYVAWRCWDSKLLACIGGASGAPCGFVDSREEPSAEIRVFCRGTSGPTLNSIPLSVAGHLNAFEWHCQNGLPVMTRQIIPFEDIDGLGYLLGVWELVP